LHRTELCGVLLAMSIALRTSLFSVTLAVAALAAVASCSSDDDSPADAPVAESDAAADAGDPGIDAALPDGSAPDGSSDAGQPDAGEPEVASNNGATLDGDDVVGNTALSRKELTLVPSGDSPIGVDYAYAAAGSGTYIRYIYKLTNKGSQDYCYISLTETVYLDADGNDLGAPAIHFLFGSVRLSDNAMVDTCLAPGESGWVLDIGNELAFADVAGVRFAVSVDDRPVSQPQARVLPTSYSFADDHITVTGENQGSASASVSFVLWVPLDADDRPLTGGYASYNTTTIAAGASHVYTDWAFFGGTMARAAFRFSFEDASSSTAAAGSPRAARIAAARAATARSSALDLAARAAR
jgi:hypothetical protein